MMRGPSTHALRACIVTSVLAAAAAVAIAPARADEQARPRPAMRVAAGDADWAALTPAQRQALAPLQREWHGLDDSRRQKWLEVAARFPSMPPDERQRVQARMAEWVRLTPEERQRARMQFQESRQWSPDSQDRKARWEAYQALSPEEREALLERSRPGKASAPPAPTRQGAAAPASVNKKNIVAAPGRPPVSARGAATPSALPAPAGATTTLPSTRAQPPAHHQTGLPKIAATPGFVDPVTLLPRRGPQGAAAVAVPAPASAAKP
jgi:hypothetical protein